LRLYEDLSRLGEIPWLDVKSLLPGEDWKNAVNKGIRNSDYFVLLLSTQAVSKKGYVQKEVREALAILDEQPDGRVYLIPVRLDNCVPGHERLRDLHWLDLFPASTNWKRGVRQIRRILDKFSPD